MRKSSRMRTARLALLSGALLTVVSLAGCGTAGTGTGGQAPATSPVPSAATSTPSTSPSASASSPPASTSPATAGTPSLPAGGQVPAGFAAASATFTSPEQAYVLGTAPCAQSPCASVLRTLDRGQHWQAVTAPAAPIGDPFVASGPAVWGIRFATVRHGFVFGNGLWETTDGGAQWVRAAYPGGTVLSVATIDGQLLILTTAGAPGNRQGSVTTLWRRPLAGGTWHLVTRVRPPSMLDPTDLIATQGQVAAVLDTGSVVVTTDGGRTVTRHATPAVVPGSVEPAVVGVMAPNGLALVCTGQGYTGHENKTLYLSSDLGSHWTKAGTPPSLGAPLAITATPGHFVIAAASAASWLYYSTDGAHWTTAYFGDDGGQGFADLGFTTSALGVAVNAPVLSDGNREHRPGRLLLTGDGGALWERVSF